MGKDCHIKKCPTKHCSNQCRTLLPQLADLSSVVNPNITGSVSTQGSPTDPASEVILGTAIPQAPGTIECNAVMSMCDIYICVHISIYVYIYVCIYVKYFPLIEWKIFYTSFILTILSTLLVISAQHISYIHIYFTITYICTCV